MDNRLSSDQKTKPCWGERVCDDRGWSFDDVFRHQFRISQTPSIASEYWKKRKLGSFSIEHCPHLPATKVLNRRGQLIGWCLGVAVDASGTVFGCGNDAHLTVSATFEAIELRQSRMAGRFAMIVQIGEEVRYYPDSASGLTAVAHDKSGVIASTLTLAIDDAVQPSGGRSLKQIQSAPTLYLMGETPDARVRQLCGNHYVDMETFTSHRFWPKEDTVFEPIVANKSVAQIAERLQIVMGALVTHLDCVLPITGGKDSRMLAAAVPASSVDQVGAYYVHQINWATSFDVRSAVQVAEHLGVPLGVKNVPSGECDAELADLDIEEARAQMALATGYAHPHLSKTVLQAMHVAPNARLLLRGGAAEMARANKYPVPRRVPDHITPEFAFQRLAGHAMVDLLEMYGEATIERYWQKYKLWFSQLPENARLRAVDLGHVELWLSGTTGAAYYAAGKHFYINPFNDRTILYQIMRFDPKLRKKGLLVKRILQRFSPGLSDVPYAIELIKQNRAA